MSKSSTQSSGINHFNYHNTFSKVQFEFSPTEMIWLNVMVLNRQYKITHSLFRRMVIHDVKTVYSLFMLFLNVSNFSLQKSSGIVKLNWSLSCIFFYQWILHMFQPILLLVELSSSWLIKCFYLSLDMRIQYLSTMRTWIYQYILYMSCFWIRYKSTSSYISHSSFTV